MGVLKFYELYKPQPKQLEAFRCIGKYARILYGGARGGAKTSFSVYAAVAASLQYPGLRTTIVRKTNKDLKKQIILGELLKHFSPKKMEGTYKYYSTDKRAAFSNGSHIFFTSIQHDSDVEKEQGIESGLYILDEGNKLAWETIQKLSASNRSTGDIVNSRGQRWKDTTIITANPGGVCDNEIKYRWITPDYSRWTEEELKMKDEYVFIKANVYDNKHLDASYLAKLKSLSEMLRRQWLDGDWDANSGAFFEEWAEKIHVVETLPNGQVTPPDDWFKWLAMDLGGGTHPSVCLWMTQDPDTGIVYVYREFSTKGVTTSFAQGVKYLSGDEKYNTGFGDPMMFYAGRSTQFDESAATMLIKEGIWIGKANNERELGWRNLKQWMHWDLETDSKLKVLSCCRGLIETVPIQQYKDNKYDLDTRGQDDFVDALRYGTAHLRWGYKYTRSGIVVQFTDIPILTRSTDSAADEERYRYTKEVANPTNLRKYNIPGTNIPTSVYSLF